MAPRFKPYPRDYYQSQLFPANVFELLPKDHECFLYRELFEQLDTSEVEAQYSERGQRAYPPHQIVSILIYAYRHGVFSSRQLEKRCREALGFLYIAGRNCPNFRVLSDFRKDHGEFFRACFKQTVQMAMGLGLVSLGHVSLDGSKFQANSSKHKAMSYGRLKQREQQLCEEIEALIAQAKAQDEEEDRAYRERTGYELPEDLRDKKKRLKKIRAAKRALERREAKLRPDQAIGDKKQISFADTDARIMKKKEGFEYAYNVQISVDEKAQVIVGQHVSQQANDAREVSPALDEVEATTGRVPERLSLDHGYYSGKNLQELSDREVEAYVVTDRGEKAGQGSLEESDRRLVKADFRYDEERDGFHCPGGQLLTLKTTAGSGAPSVSGRCGGVRVVSVLSSLLPFEGRGGAHDQERRSGAVASGHERADEATGKPSAVRATQDDRGAGVRSDQERRVPRVRSAWQGEGGRGVLAGLRGAQPQENHSGVGSGRGVSGGRETSGSGVKQGRVRRFEAENRPRSAPPESKTAQKTNPSGLEGRIRWVSELWTIAHEHWCGRKSLNTDFSDRLLGDDSVPVFARTHSRSCRWHA